MLKVIKLATFTSVALSNVPANIRFAWDFCGRNVFTCDNKSYGCRHALGVLHLLKLKKLDDCQGSFSYIKFI